MYLIISVYNISDKECGSKPISVIIIFSVSFFFFFLSFNLTFVWLASLLLETLVLKLTLGQIILFVFRLLKPFFVEELLIFTLLCL